MDIMSNEFTIWINWDIMMYWISSCKTMVENRVSVPSPANIDSGSRDLMMILNNQEVASADILKSSEENILLGNLTATLFSK